MIIYIFLDLDENFILGFSCLGNICGSIVEADNLDVIIKDVDFQYLPCHWKQDCVINDTPIKHSCHRSVLFKAIHNPKFFFFPKSNWCQVRLAKVSFQKFFLIPCTHLPQGCCLSGRSVSKQIWLHNIETYTSVQLGQFFETSFVHPFPFNSILVDSRSIGHNYCFIPSQNILLGKFITVDSAVTGRKGSDLLWEKCYK